MASTRNDIDRFLEKLSRLREAYESAGLLQAVAGRGERPATARADLLRTMQFCDALVRNVLGTPRPADSGAHVCVFGGTQVGKSTMVNVLARRAMARVYHTAGYTRHAQGFGAGFTCGAFQSQYARAFPRFTCVPREELALAQPFEYSATDVPPFSNYPNVVLWDAPDCDAIDAHLYQAGLIEALTVADVVVYVTSREKYAVNHLLGWLASLLQTGVPVVGVLNMTPTAQQAELLQSMAGALASVQERLALGTLNPLRETIALEYVTGGDSSPLFEAQSAEVDRLRLAVKEAAAVARQSHSARQSTAFAYLDAAMQELIAPARSVLDAREQWGQAVDGATSRFVDDYRNGYLDDPQRYDAFKQVGIEILKLLNPPVPGLQKALYTVRTVLSLPARAILMGSRALWRFAQSQQSGGGARGPVVPNEVGTYQEAHARVLNTVSGRLARQQGTGSHEEQVFWSALGREWSQRMEIIQHDFEAKLAQHRARTDEWVQQTAHGIYAELEKDPVKLNLLRTGRIAADAGAIVVAVHTGGHGNILHDLIVTPAVMSVIEAISQQIAGSYVEARRLELRDRLLADTKVFAEEVYGKQLQALATQALQQTGFAGIDAALLAELPRDLERLRS